MKKILFGLSLLCSTMAFAQVKMPQASPAQTIKQDFGLGFIEIKYSRPAAKGRVIFGDLVPFDKLWRTGANSNTTIRFSEPVIFDGEKIDTGIYSLYTMPGKEQWQVLLNKSTSNWGVNGYDEKQVVTKIVTKAQESESFTESFTIGLENVLPQTCNLVLSWEKTRVVIPIKADFTDKLKASLNEAMKGDKKPYYSAAQYYDEYENNPKKALEMVELHLKTNDTQFWAWLYKARLEAKLGNKAAALKSSEKSMELAKKQNNDDYIKLNDDFQKSLK